MTRSRKLQDFLAANAAEPWTPGGRVDCCLALAEWAIWLGHSDPAAHLRGAYTEGQGQVDILASRGGALELVRECAESIGGKKTDALVAGTIGVLGSSENPKRQIGAIFDGARWLTRTRKGWVPVMARHLAAWKI